MKKSLISIAGIMGGKKLYAFIDEYGHVMYQMWL